MTLRVVSRLCVVHCCVVLALVALSCQSTDGGDSPTAPTPSSAPERSGLIAKFKLAPSSRMVFQLGKYGAKGGGLFSGEARRGQVQIDLLDLAQVHGRVDVQLSRLSMIPTPEHTTESEHVTALALNWLELGSEVSAKAREQFGLSSFELLSLGKLSHSAPHEGKVQKKPAPDPAMVDPDDGSSSPAELRRMYARLEGTLLIHGLRVERRADVSLFFEYPGEAVAGMMPTRVRVKSRRPLLVRFGSHDILPRDATGTHQSGLVPGMKKRVGIKARVKLDLVFARLGGRRGPAGQKLPPATNRLAQ